MRTGESVLTSPLYVLSIGPLAPFMVSVMVERAKRSRLKGGGKNAG